MSFKFQLIIYHYQLYPTTSPRNLIFTCVSCIGFNPFDKAANSGEDVRKIRSTTYDTKTGYALQCKRRRRRVSTNERAAAITKAHSCSRIQIPLKKISFFANFISTKTLKQYASIVNHCSFYCNSFS